jgi:quercetin dioxygenase-like cupin family protein
MLEHNLHRQRRPGETVRRPGPLRNVRYGRLLLAVSAVAVGLTAGVVVAGQPPRPVTTPVASGTLASAAHTMTIAHGAVGTAASVAEVSDVRLVRFTLAPGGAFPWHQHPGPVWVIVTRGTLTFYSATCQSHAYPTGSAFFDPGNLTHTALNEGSEPVEIIATFLFPANAGSAASIPQPAPATCPVDV